MGDGLIVMFKRSNSTSLWLWWGHHFYGYNLAYSLEWEFDLFSDCRKAPTCTSCHGFIWIPIWVFYYSMERSPSLLWDGSNLMWIPNQSRSQSLILYRYVFCQWWVCSYMLLLMILRIDSYLIMLWWLGTMEKKEGLKERRGGAKEQQRRPSQVGVSIQVKLESNSDSRNNRHQNHRPDHIPTPFWTFFIWMES
jgi:hypothetical protein